MSLLDQQIRKRMGRRRSFLDVSLKVDGIIEILEKCSSPVSYTDLRKDCRIKAQSSFLKYRRFCMEKELMIHTVRTKVSPASHYSFYVLTEKGRMFLRCLQ